MAVFQRSRMLATQCHSVLGTFGYAPAHLSSTKTIVVVFATKLNRLYSLFEVVMDRIQ